MSAEDAGVFQLQWNSVRARVVHGASAEGVGLRSYEDWIADTKCPLDSIPNGWNLIHTGCIYIDHSVLINGGGR